MDTYVDNTDDEVEVLGHQVLVVVRDEDSSNVELNVVPLLLGLKQVKGSTLRNVEHGLELELTLNGEVLDGKVVLPVVGNGLVEAGVLLLGDVLRVPIIKKSQIMVYIVLQCKNLPGPDGLLLVELLVLSGGLLDLLGLLGLLARVLVLDLLNLGVTLLDLLLLVLNLLLGLLGDDELDRVGDELGLGDTSSAFGHSKRSDPAILTCFLTISLILFSSRYSFKSSLMKSFIEVPRPSRGPSVSSVMVKVPPAADSQMYCSSSLCLVVTCTFSATR